MVLGAVSAPSLMGNFAAKEAAMDMSAPRSGEPAEALMDAAEDQSVYHTVETESAINEDGKSAANPAEKPVTSAVPGNSAETPTYSEKPETTLYVGELLLEGPVEMLDEYEGAASSDGNVTYLVPAAVFADVLELLETEKPVGYAYTAGTPDAELGRIIVQSN